MSEIKVSDVNVKHTTVNESAQNSFEFGKAGCRHKIYWKTLQELKNRIVECKEAENILRKIELEETERLVSEEMQND